MSVLKTYDTEKKENETMQFEEKSKIARVAKKPIDVDEFGSHRLVRPVNSSLRLGLCFSKQGMLPNSLAGTRIQCHLESFGLCTIHPQCPGFDRGRVDSVEEGEVSTAYSQSVLLYSIQDSTANFTNSAAKMDQTTANKVCFAV
ncbi:hypothetical protein L596_021217 [Steinernema carpocapsae]|uniref:Uncharacterized protein n=1 Tax=Steinernema carpocapsae TaxID=34508 RepID=A0A4U5MWY9_STECR|nr:hypothetical protein L596_021217 [Steinernema carpocapsae]